MITPQKVKAFVGASELTVSEIECWIMCHGLIQQMYSLACVLDHACVERCLSQRLLAAEITIVGNKIGCRWLLDRCLFCWRELGLELVGDGFGNLALNGKDIVERPIVPVGPEMDVISCVD